MNTLFTLLTVLAAFLLIGGAVIRLGFARASKYILIWLVIAVGLALLYPYVGPQMGF